MNQSNRRCRRRPAAPVRMGIAALILVALSAGAAGAGEPGLDSTSDSAFGGFYAALFGQAVNVTLNRDDRATPVPEDFRYEEWGGGVDLALGYVFGPRFECEFGGSVSGFDARPEGTHVVALDARITGYVPIRSEWRFHPMLIGGVGVTAIAWFSEEFTDRLYLTARGDLGGGFRFRASRRFMLRAEFIYSTHDVERELLDPDDEADLRHVDGLAWTRTVRAGIAWDF